MFQFSASENEVTFDFPHDVLYRCQRNDCICFWKFYKRYASSICLFEVPYWKASRGKA